MAIAFSIFGFAYLYAVPYYKYFSWEANELIFWNSIFYSISNSLTVNYPPVEPIGHWGYVISIIQLVIMFIFFSVLLSGSIPQINSIMEKDGKNGIQK
jgi:preprotein translocase subunit SecY